MTHGDPLCDAAHGEVVLPVDTRRLVLVFDSPVAREVLLLAQRLGWPVTLVDASPVPELGADCDVVVCDHDRKELGDLLAEVLAQPTRWVGVMGAFGTQPRTWRRCGPEEWRSPTSPGCTGPSVWTSARTPLSRSRSRRWPG